MKFNDVNIEQRVLEQVANIIFNKGIKGWNMDQLSEQVGLAKNTLYKIIGSKEDLIEKVVLSYIRRVQTTMVEIIKSETDYMIALEKIVNTFPELLNSLYADSLQEIFNEYPRIEKSVVAHRDDMTKSIILFIKTGMDCNALRNDLRPELVFEIFQAIVLHYVKSGYKGQEMALRISAAFKCVVHGISDNSR